jgi:hypothetical protein
MLRKAVYRGVAVSLSRCDEVLADAKKREVRIDFSLEGGL